MKAPELFEALFPAQVRKRIRKSIKNIQVDGIRLGAGDYVDIKDLKFLCGKSAFMLTHIALLERMIIRLEKQNAAMLHDMVHVVPGEICDACAHAQGEAQCEKYDFDCDKCPVDCPCKTCHGDHPNFKWRGVCAKNTKEEATT